MELLSGYLRAILRWKWMILLITLTCAVTAGIASLQLPKVYQSTAVGLVSPKQLLPASGVNTNDPTQVPSIDQLVETYVGLINTEPVREHLIADGIPRGSGILAGSISAQRQPNTTLITVTVNDNDPAVALSIAQKIIPAFNASLTELQAKVGSAPSSHLDSLVVWEVPAGPPDFPVSPNIPRSVLLAAVAGLVVSLGIALVLDKLDDSLKNEADVRSRLGLTLLGSVTTQALPDGGAELGLISSTHTSEPVVEQYRALRTNLMYARAQGALRSLIVTSTIPAEGKTTTASNLAVLLAQTGTRVILVDADFRKPAVHHVFGVHQAPGLGDLILKRRPESEVIQQTSIPNLRVVGCGLIPPNPSELLGSVGMQKAVSRLKRLSGIVIIDTPPVAAVTDAAVLSAMVDGVLLVVERGGPRIGAITKAIESLNAVGANILGAVVNRARLDDASGYYYYHYYNRPDKAAPADTRAIQPRVAPTGPPARSAPEV